MTRTFVLDEGVVISAHTGIDPNTDEESDEAYRVINCIGQNRHRMAWSYEAWHRYHRQAKRYRDGGVRPHVLALVRALASNTETSVAISDEMLEELQHPTEVREDDRIWIRLMIAAYGDLATTDGRLQTAVRRSAHYSHLGARVHLVPEALPLACGST